MKKTVSLLIAAAILFSFSLDVFAFNSYYMMGVGFLPSFPVTVNGQEYNYNEYEEFPLIVNGGVTYFPLTYNNSLILNLIPEYKKDPLSIAYTRGDPEVPKHIFKKLLIKKLEPSEIKEIHIDTAIYQTHHPKAERNDDMYNFGTQRSEEYFKRHGIEFTIDGENIAALSEYPIFYFRNIYYIPLSWQFVTEVLGGTVSFDFERGLEVRVNNFFTTLNETEKITYTENVFVKGHSENATYYIKDDLTVSLTSGYHELYGASSENLKITRGNITTAPKGCFGVLQGTDEFACAPQFTVDGTKIKTFISTERGGLAPKPCVVDIQTGEVSFS